MPKWLPDISPDDLAVDVAARALAARLDLVRRYLKRTAKTMNVEDVHQLRVTARRADAALSLYADLLPRKQLKWLRKWMTRLRRAAGHVRDSDVLADRVVEADAHWPVRLRAERWRGQKKVRRLAERLDGGRWLKRRTRKLLNRLGTDHTGATERFSDRARTGLRPLVDAFFAAVSGVTPDDAALHRFRIRGKELRYAMELLAGAFPPAFRDDLYPLVTSLQERLGLVNDLSTAQRRLEEWLAGTGDPATISRLHRRLAVVREELVRARADFHQWWTPDQQNVMRTRFDEFLGSPMPLQ
jgi:CHAD domain-containing protein